MSSLESIHCVSPSCRTCRVYRGTVATERVQRRAHLLSGSGVGVAVGPVTHRPRSGMRRSRRLGSIFVPVPPPGGLPWYISITKLPVSSAVPSDGRRTGDAVLKPPAGARSGPDPGWRTAREQSAICGPRPRWRVCGPACDAPRNRHGTTG